MHGILAFIVSFSHLQNNWPLTWMILKLILPTAYTQCHLRSDLPSSFLIHVFILDGTWKMKCFSTSCCWILGMVLHTWIGSLVHEVFFRRILVGLCQIVLYIIVDLRASPLLMLPLPSTLSRGRVSHLYIFALIRVLPTILILGWELQKVLLFLGIGFLCKP